LRRHPLAACVASLALAAVANLCLADVRVVLNCNDSGSGSLRDTVASAGNADIVDLSQLACSRITLTSTGISTNLDNLSIVGPGASRLTIEGPRTPETPLADFGSAAGTFYVAYLTVADGRGVGPGCVYAKGNLSLRGVTVTGCSTAGNVGGALRTRQNLTMVDSTLSGNAERDNDGGAGAWVDGDADISGSTIENNTVTTQYSVSTIRGGGIYVGGNLRLTGSSVTGNSIITSTGVPVAGGGVYVKGDAYIAHSVITGNVASGSGAYARGGGVYVGTRAGATNYAYFAYSTLSANTVSSSTTGSVAFVEGGGVHSAKPFAFKFSTLDHNQSNGEGGGISAGAAAHLNVISSTLSGNVANLQGGAIFTRYGKTMLLLNSTIGLNASRTVSCAGIFFYSGGTLTTESSILAKNTKYNSTNGECDIGGNSPLTISASNGHNLIQNSVATVPADTISGDPQFFTLASNGGPTKTLGIAQSSPARGMGSNLFSLTWDQRGPGYPRAAAGNTDIGAFEWQRPGDGDTIFANGFEP
jgi:hypothetical protein